MKKLIKTHISVLFLSTCLMVFGCGSTNENKIEKSMENEIGVNKHQKNS